MHRPKTLNNSQWNKSIIPSISLESNKTRSLEVLFMFYSEIDKKNAIVSFLLGYTQVLGVGLELISY